MLLIMKEITPGSRPTPEQIEEATQTGELPVPPPYVERADVFDKWYLYLVYKRTKAGEFDVRPSLGELMQSGLKRSFCFSERKKTERIMGKPKPVAVRGASTPHPLVYVSAYEVFKVHYLYHTNRRNVERRFMTRPSVDELARTSNIPERTCEEYRERYEGEFEAMMAA
ncbi:hypothetical protein CCAX7_54820 [Capsulimonas corticalis]|uniref:Uncharacterized protein n=1 Tax=Capsulimonas corticalis TaxID=2219043 RepID=A0A402D5S8_9BACT|nr:hypothetical protein [Capsulimonas corticalis]BDI33431.1 hypothetical protein CCAX7_54820 [Capsulimonas corticalis]